MSDRDEVIKLLRSIDQRLARIEKQGAQAQGPEVADDRELDSQYGDPVVKFHPRDWTGGNYKGSPFSACPPDLLDQLAGAFDYFARKAEESGETTNAGKPVAPYKRKDAARARGWAKRLRAGWKPAQVASSFGNANAQTGELQDEPAAPFDDPLPGDAGFEDSAAWAAASPLEELTADDIPF